MIQDSTILDTSPAEASSGPTLLRPSELARLTGVSTDTLRHYERKGVLPPPRRAANGYRKYAANDALPRIRTIRRALRLGFTLDELARVLRARDTAARGEGSPPCRAVRDLAAAKLAEVEARLQDLTLLRDELRNTLAEWDARLARTAEDERAGLLEALPETGEPSVGTGLCNSSSSPLPPLRVRKKHP